LVLACSSGKYYDQRKIQCLPPDEAESCPLNNEGRSEPPEQILPTVQIQPYQQLCPSEGTFGSPNDCQTFIKCSRNARGILSGNMYQCPEGQSYSDTSKKCEKKRIIALCNKPGPKLNWQTSLAPVLANV